MSVPQKSGYMWSVCYTQARTHGRQALSERNCGAWTKKCTLFQQPAPHRTIGIPRQREVKGTIVTQHDHQTGDDNSFDTSNGATSHARPEDVTREQGGQFYMESESIPGPPDDFLEAEQEARISKDGVENITAMQVTMDQSGAEYIHAQKAFLTNSGAKSIAGGSSKLNQSGVLELRTEKANLHQSSAVLVFSDQLQMESSSIAFSSSGTVTMHKGANVAVMQARSVEAAGDIRTFMLLSNNVKAGGNIESTMDLSTATVFGAVFGVVFAFIWKVIRRD